MNKREFIERLSMALNGRIAPNLVAENVNYYEDYINMEIRKGRSENEVLQMLGDPRLIAKTIIATSNKEGQNTYQDGRDNASFYRETGYTGDNWEHDRSYKKMKMSVLLGKVITILIICLIFGAILSVLSFLAPIILPMLVLVFCVKLFRDWLN